ncbi:MAG TPA: DUF2949 domain-containing protein [Stenomitos sp.]
MDEVRFKSLYETSIPNTRVNSAQFIEYLKEKQGLTPSAIALATRTCKPTAIELPIVLWQNGLIDLDQLGDIFDWLEKVA